ncbi:MAG: glycosyltransferase [Candidatus Aminicenantes bacterium]|nr:glycosyltransferase [Candidatus Aminicenantes bacterium]
MIGPAALPPVVVLSQSDWGLAWVFAQDLASHFAARGHAVVYVNPFPKRFPRPREWRRLLGRFLDRPRLTGSAAHTCPPGLHVRTPLTLPDRNRLFAWINRRLLLPGLRRRVLAAAGGRPLVFIFQPFATAVAFAAMLDPARLVYARRDSYSDDPRLDRLQLRESELLAKADLVVCAGPVLAARSSEWREKALDIPGLVDFAAFFRPLAEKPAVDPLCCYFGHLNQRVDLPLLQAVAERFPLRLIGPIGVDWSPGKEVECLGMVPVDRLPDLLADTDVVIIPYRLSGFSRSIFPYKIFQAFAQGKPVVATRLPALEPLSSLLYFAATADEFKVQIARAAGEGLAVRRRRQEVARQHDRGLVLESLRQRLLGGAAEVS